MESIEELILNGDLETAKSLICDLEAKLEQEPSKSIQANLKQRISKLKELYFSKVSISLKSTKEKEDLAFEVSSQFTGNSEKFIVQNANMAKISAVTCSEAKIENCSNIKTKLITARNSIVLKDVKNADVSLKASQIRLVGCTDVKLRVFTRTGVFLQDSSEIQISPLSTEEGNLYRSVFDFTDPSGGNYSFL